MADHCLIVVYMSVCLSGGGYPHKNPKLERKKDKKQQKSIWISLQHLWHIFLKKPKNTIFLLFIVSLCVSASKRVHIIVITLFFQFVFIQNNCSVFGIIPNVRKKKICTKYHSHNNRTKALQFQHLKETIFTFNGFCFYCLFLLLLLRRY